MSPGLMRRPASMLLVASLAPCAACSPAPRPTGPIVIASAAPSPIVVESPARDDAPRPEIKTCRIPGPKATLTLAITAGSEELNVTVEGARTTLVPGERGASAVEVTGALEFQGRAEGIDLYPAAPLEVAGGVVQLGPMSVLQNTSPRGASIVAETVDIGPPFALSQVTVPCSALSFVGSGDPSEEAHRGTKSPRLRRPSCPQPCTHYTTPDVLDFHANPGGGAHVRLTGSTIVSELERRGDWTRVATEDFVHMDGAQLTGWVEHARLTKLSGGFGFTGGRGFGSLPTRGRAGAVRAGGFRGPAHIDAGTRVFTLSTGGEPWATIRDGEAEIEVFIKPGNDRAEILSAPFIPHLTSAWVPVAAVHPIPAKTGP